MWTGHTSIESNISRVLSVVHYHYQPSCHWFGSENVSEMSTKVPRVTQGVLMHYMYVMLCAGSLLYHCINVGLLYTYLASGRKLKEHFALSNVDTHTGHQDDWIDPIFSPRFQ